MIKMEILMDEDKIMAEGRYALAEIYDRIDKTVRRRGITKHDSDGLLLGNGVSNDFSHFALIIIDLKDQRWFFPYAKKWVWYVGDEVNDLIQYYGRKKAQGHV